jgi:hypothetical protein
MQKLGRTSLDGEEWNTIRDFSEKGDGTPLPKYEAKFVRDVEKEFIDDDLVLVKETKPFGSERTYHVPREVVADIARLLPD